MSERQDVMKEFLAAMYRYVPSHARVLGCQFRGDPNADQPGKWRATPITTVAQLDDQANVYLTVSAMQRNERGEFRRRKDNFAGGVLLMIDDIGTGAGSKFPLSILETLQPTALIETSPGNHQAIYMFDSLVTDSAAFDALITGFIAKQFLGHDTGMAGINRVFRPPYGVNGKQKYSGWHVVCRAWNPEARYSIARIAEAFKVNLDEHHSVPLPHTATANKADNIRAFVTVRQALRDAGMLKKAAPDPSGWQDIVCPWTAGHTDAADNGAAIREPADENGWFGAFRCHHASCAGRGWKDLTEWLAEHQSELLERINATAPGFETFKDYL